MAGSTSAGGPSIDLGGQTALYLQRAGQAWEVRAARRAGWEIEYEMWQGGLPRLVRLRSTDAADARGRHVCRSRRLKPTWTCPTSAFDVEVPAGVDGVDGGGAAPGRPAARAMTRRTGAAVGRCVRRRGATYCAAVMCMPGPAVGRPQTCRGRRAPVWRHDVVRAYPHDRDAFTQGLVFRDGALFESTGLNGQSSLRRVDLATGRVTRRVSVDRRYFAEGLAVVGTQPRAADVGDGHRARLRPRDVQAAAHLHLPGRRLGPRGRRPAAGDERRDVRRSGSWTP